MASKPGDVGMLRRFVHVAKPYKQPLRNVYILYLLNSVLNLVPAASLRYYIDLVVEKKPVSLFGMHLDLSEHLHTVRDQIMWSVGYFGLALVLIVSANIVGVWMWRYGTRVTQRIILDMKQLVHRHLHKLNISYFDEERTGGIMSRTVGDVEQIEQMIQQSFSLFYGFIHLVTVPVIMIGMSPLLFLLVLPPIPVISIAVWRIRRKMRPLYKAMREQRAQIGAAVQEQISGIKEIKAFGKEKTARNDYARANLTLVRQVHQAMRIFSINHQLLYGLNDLAIVLVGVGGGVMVVTGTGSVTLGMVVAFIPLLGRLYNPIRQFVGFYDVIQRGLASAERVFEFLDTEPDIQDRPHARLVEFPHGKVEFEHVTFGYTPEQPVIRDLSLLIEPGQKAAIVGTTGAGKSTIVNLLMRFYEPQEGRILIDDHDISRIQLDSLVHAIGMVFQETFLFYGTLAQNIAFSRANASFDQIREAARKANIAEFIESLPDGYDTMVGERGTKLSGGQRQRIAIARMILKDPQIVILDEATSAVDNKTEKLIQDSLDHLMEGRTSIIIAHRLSTIRNADTVLVMEEGRLLEMGPPDELLSRGGRFQDMWQAQTF